MIEFEFSVKQENLGHIILKKDNLIITTSENPPQASMIFIAIADLIDGIIELIKEKKMSFYLSVLTVLLALTLRELKIIFLL